MKQIRRVNFGIVFFCWIVVLLHAQESASDISLDSLLSTPINAGAKYDQLISQVPASTTIITSDDIRRFGYRTLEDVLNTVRGFYTSYDRNYTYVGVRGFSRPTDYNNRILLLLNGQTVNENFYGSASLGTDFTLDLSIIERIEIIRGPSSVLYGTGAMFAVINIITKKPAAVDGLYAKAEIGSLGTKSAAFYLGCNLAETNILLAGNIADVKGDQLYFSEYDADSTNFGVARDLDYDRYRGAFLQITRNNFTLTGYITPRKKGIPTAVYETTFNDPNTMTFDQTKGIDLTYTYMFSYNLIFNIRATADRYDYYGTYPINEDLTHDLNLGIRYRIEPQLQWDILENDRIVFGGDYQYNSWALYKYWGSSTIYFDKNFPFEVGSLYIDNECQIVDNLMVRGGIRYDKYSSNLNSLSPRFAVIYNPLITTTVKLLYGEAFRIPSVYEKYYNDPVSGFKSNPSLLPEKIQTSELVVEQRLTNEIFCTASLYNYHMRELIDTKIDSVDGLSQFQNISTVSASGFEAELGARLSSGLYGYMSYSYQRAKNNLQEELSNLPAHLMKAGISFPVDNNLSLALYGRYETKRKTVYLDYTTDYFILNSNISYRLFNSSFSASLIVYNIFDTQFFSPGGFDHIQHSILQNGRTIFFRLSYKTW